RFPSNRHVTAKPRRDLLDATNCGLVVFTHVHDLVFGRPLTEGMLVGLATHIKSRRCATAPKNESGTVGGVSRDVVTAVPNLVPALEAVPERLTPATRKTGKKQTSKSAQLQASRANRKALTKATAPIDLAAAASIEDLDAEIRKHGQAYAPEPGRVSTELWERLRELTLRLTAGYAPATTVQFTTVANAVVTFLAWVTQLPGRGGQTPTPEELVDERLVEEYIEVLITHLDGGRSPKTTRTRLRRAVRSLRATPAHITLPGRKLATPYSPAECARMCQLVEHQNAFRKQNLAFVLALGLGAGIAAREFRHITRDQIIAHPRDGFDVQIRNGNYPRTIPVRNHYVPLLTGALEQFDSNKENTTTDLLIGTNPDRKHFLDPKSRTLKVADGRNTVIDMNRARTTWLFAMMNAPIPLASLLYLAGLSSARTLAELLRFCPPPRAANVRAVITELKDTGFDLGEVAK
ncbi:MAG TPA: hypothetical protein VK054_02805, partial [Beutenbergiaceae bacterium]|nr:hypothetical protein [Beutenbergiaceae bacterium]